MDLAWRSRGILAPGAGRERQANLNNVNSILALNIPRKRAAKGRKASPKEKTPANWLLMVTSCTIGDNRVAYFACR